MPVALSPDAVFRRFGDVDLRETFTRLAPPCLSAGWCVFSYCVVLGFLLLTDRSRPVSACGK
jgi:hypothetical protein